MDAILATDNFQLGACCSVKNVQNPIKLARVVMEKTKHVMVVGDGCTRLAQEVRVCASRARTKALTPRLITASCDAHRLGPSTRQFNVPVCRTADLLVGRERERFEALRQQAHYDPKSSFLRQDSAALVADGSAEEGGISRRGKVNGMGTVGVVCLDTSGRMAVGLSTGGTPFKRPGRVGDTPQWGSGAYVEAGLGGAAATGRRAALRLGATGSMRSGDGRCVRMGRLRVPAWCDRRRREGPVARFWRGHCSGPVHAHGRRRSAKRQAGGERSAGCRGPPHVPRRWLRRCDHAGLRPSRRGRSRCRVQHLPHGLCLPDQRRQRSCRRPRAQRHSRGSARWLTSEFTMELVLFLCVKHVCPLREMPPLRAA